MCKRIRQYYSNMVDKPSELHRITEIFAPTILNLTLWMAIASFSFIFVVEVDIFALEWFSSVSNMNTPEDALLLIRWVVIFAFGIPTVFSSLVVAYLIITWVVINIRRYFRSKK